MGERFQFEKKKYCALSYHVRKQNKEERKEAENKSKENVS